MKILYTKEDAERRRAERAAWRAEEDRKKTECKDRLEREHGLTEHPKRGALWSLAWSHGHANGFCEVEYYYGEFAELLKPARPLAEEPHE